MRLPVELVVLCLYGGDEHDEVSITGEEIDGLEKIAPRPLARLHALRLPQG